ncbi:MAG: SGNH/GDSL hydrolase family protein [Planctomycetota bacterium]
MRMPLLFIVASLAAAADQAPKAQAMSIVAGAAISDQIAQVPDSVVERVRTTKTMLVVGSDNSPLAKGLSALAKHDARYQLRIGKGPMSASWYKGGAVGIHRAPSAVRADKSAETFARIAKRDGSNIDVAAMELAPDAFPNGRTIQVPYRQFTAGMDINLSNTALDSVFTENIVSYATQGNGTATTINPGVNYPVELPNVGINHLSTHVKVPAGLGTPEPGWKVDDGPSPRDPRQALKDVHGAVDTVAAERPALKVIWTTMPLAVRGNAQRNWYNAQVRSYTAEHKIPLIDVAEIMATGRDGKIATDGEGPVMAAEWVAPGTSVANEDLQRRVAAAYWWTTARVTGWDGTVIPPVTAQAQP